MTQSGKAVPRLLRRLPKSADTTDDLGNPQQGEASDASLVAERNVAHQNVGPTDGTNSDSD